MMGVFTDILETISIAVSGFMIRKYVFLEPDLEAGKQRAYYLLSMLIIGILFLALGKDAATMSALALVGLNICLGRKKNRLSGFLMMIPILGIINGLLVPILLVPPYLLMLSGQETALYQIIVYGGLFLLMILFYIKGKSWRSWFRETVKHRSLRGGEKCLLWVIGVLMLFFATEVAAQTESTAMEMVRSSTDYGHRLASFIGISSIAAFVMTITIIVLIMQGNRRSFYHNQVTGMQSGIITMMAEIVENRDDNTGGHIRRTARYVEMIARQLQKMEGGREILTDRYMQDMIVAAPLHDIGKIHIPDAVLNKPGRLTKEEFDIMKTHTTAGQELLIHARDELGESGYLNTAIEMAAYHHEWWNGKGYPYGISGVEIPLCARIMAVADVFDALTSKRCYKDAMPLEKAYAIIREESGTHFDPAVTAAFFAAGIRE